MKSHVAKLMLILTTLNICTVETVNAFYDPGVQRWINRDPLGDIAGLPVTTADITPWSDSDGGGDEVEGGDFMDGWIQVKRNLYGAMGNNPVKHFDAFGLEDSSINACARNDPGEVGKIARDLIKESKDFSKEFQRLEQLAKNAKKMDVKELARRFKLPQEKFHGVKDKILDQLKSEFKKRGLGNNPDVLIDAEGNVVLRTAKGFVKNVWNTAIKVTSYCE